MSQLQDQMEQIREAFAGKLSERVSVSDNFLQAKVAGDLFQVFVSHESMHAGMITAMIKTLKNK